MFFVADQIENFSGYLLIAFDKGSTKYLEKFFMSGNRIVVTQTQFPQINQFTAQTAKNQNLLN
jgi:hypothetical protein